MSDRELLELAAKAAKIKYSVELGDWRHEDWCRYWSHDDFCTCGGEWNPLKNDGDALRLAIALKLDIEFHLPEGGVTSMNYDACAKFNTQGAGEKLGEDEGAATRRAITRAAAQIGKAMP